ncbi:MAG: MFS transporter [Verrucomicrobiaceae bacterium]|nr:MFS transporter [Verrucomicrobiaceae bacterium]
MTSAPNKWYSSVTRYQWLVLVVASLGWIFDAFEGQIFNLTRKSMLSEILGMPGDSPDVKAWGDIVLGVFLVGGTLGGWLFGMLADRWGRNPTMILTILFYSVFSGLTYFASSLWEVCALRFLVAMGVGGEWAVAAALVAEVFPKEARARASGIFHATSVLATWLAGVTGMWVGANWRMAYLIGVIPAVLTLWVRASIKEPERLQTAQKTMAGRVGSFRELFGNPKWRLRALCGMTLAAVGLGTFWGVTVAGQDLMSHLLTKLGMSKDIIDSESKFAYGIVQATGGGLGMLAFGPICERIGRRRTFFLMQGLSLLVVPAVCYLPQTQWQMLLALPLMGFCTLSIHAGFAVYFPELFPDHLRATGSSFCFNTGRLLAAPILFTSGKIKAAYPDDLPFAITMLSGLFVIGLIVLLFLPETKGEELPE